MMPGVVHAAKWHCEFEFVPSKSTLDFDGTIYLLVRNVVLDDTCSNWLF